jgi:hypothetical protein
MPVSPFSGQTVLSRKRWFGLRMMAFKDRVVLRRHKKADLSDRLNCLILLSEYGRVIRTLDP